MTVSTHTPHPKAAYYSQQYKLRATADQPDVVTRWTADSIYVRRTAGGLFDLAYGDSSNERLDFFPAYGSNRPLMVFIHGGWWRSMDKSEFSFVARAYMRAGVNVALPNYSLAPAASMDEIVRQNLQALAWLYRHADQYDFDRERIVVAGHSAGAHLSAMLMAAVWPALAADLPPDLVKAGVLLSGVYDLEPLRHADFVNADLKLASDDIPRLSPAYLPQSHATPFITAVGGKETEEHKRQNALISDAWRNAHRSDIALPNDDHLTICDRFSEPDSPLFQATMKLIESL